MTIRSVYVISSSGKRKTVKLQDPEGCTYGELTSIIAKEVEFDAEPHVKDPIECIPDDDDICTADDKLYFTEVVRPAFAVSLATQMASTSISMAPPASAFATDNHHQSEVECTMDNRVVTINGEEFALFMTSELNAFAKTNQAAIHRVFETLKPINPVMYKTENVFDWFNSVLVRSAVVVYKFWEVHAGYMSTLRRDAADTLYKTFLELVRETHKHNSALLKDIKAALLRVNDCFDFGELTEYWPSNASNAIRSKRHRNKSKVPSKGVPPAALDRPQEQFDTVEEVCTALMMTTDKNRLAGLYRDNAKMIANYFRSLQGRQDLIDGSVFETVLDQFPSLIREMAFVSEVYNVYMQETYAVIPNFGKFIEENVDGIIALANERNIPIPTSTDKTFAAAFVLPAVFNHCLKRSAPSRGNFIVHTERITDIHTLKEQALKATKAPQIIVMSSNANPKFYVLADGKDYLLPTGNCASAVQRLFEFIFLLNLEYDAPMKPFFDFMEVAAGLKSENVKNAHIEVAKMIRHNSTGLAALKHAHPSIPTMLLPTDTSMTAPDDDDNATPSEDESRNPEQSPVVVNPQTGLIDFNEEDISDVRLDGQDNDESSNDPEGVLSEVDNSPSDDEFSPLPFSRKRRQPSVPSSKQLNTSDSATPVSSRKSKFSGSEGPRNLRKSMRTATQAPPSEYDTPKRRISMNSSLAAKRPRK